ncbi:hypothetical protein, partial [Olavius algarvensis spirochete endosymbiont]|uniref:hypothetical protein n=1 Tax=Olavius algarvensis spirochete endosymbiont TaxID=260710 RepID=UPI0011CDC14E
MKSSSHFTISGSGNFGGSVDKTTEMLMDITGDGLPDYVKSADKQNYFKARINIGDGFAESPLMIYKPNWSDADMTNTPSNESLRSTLD